ncbi:MAG TPA: hypothetical protein VG347_17890 [Verrucomicrobiae bacterium]|nr:hypothetical protein [Verrucomicrobiae bacterium]
MKNSIRVIVVVLLAVAVLSYLHWYRGWHMEQMERAGHHGGINCVNNLKQIGLAFKIWSGDNADKFPFSTSTNAGGTLELCAPDKDGFDGNAYLFLRAMSNELSATKLLICPLDHDKKAAVDWPSLTASNITYRFRTGYKISSTNPREILAVCPLDGNVLYCDGTVADKNGKSPAEDPNALNVR